jgi:tetratricopeptide (TPR) repeat protein
MKDLSNEEKDALEAVRIAPMDKEGAVLLISFYRKAGDLEKAQKYADLVKNIYDREQAQQSYGRDLRDTLDKAEPLLMRGEFAQALPLYESLIRQLPTFYEAYFDLGMCYGQTGRPHDAEAAFRKFLEYQPVSADGHASLGVLLLGEGRGPEAIPELTEALQIDPSLTEARKALATEYLHESKPKSAVAVLRPAENEKDEQVLVLLALALQKSSSYPGALAAVNRALALSPDDAHALEIKKQIQASTKHD